MQLFRRYGLPLLFKELLELSARKRTYFVRVAYAVVVLLASCIVLYGSLPSVMTPGASTLGIGFPVLMWLWYLQRTGLFLLLPILACGVFTVEKERNTLGLLFLTQLGPGTIVLEKFASRWLLALSFLLISLPVVAFAYSLGGISFDDLAAQFYSLLVTSIRVVAICILCSAYCRTTVAALFASYVLIYSLGVLNFLIVQIVSMQLSGGARGIFPLLEYLSWRLFFDFPPLNISNLTAIGRVPPGWMGLFPRQLLASIPTLLTSVLWLILARRFLVSRAFAQPSQRLKRIFQWLDRFFQRANQNRWTRGIELTRRDNQLPDEAPVAWREMTTQSIGHMRYLVRLFLSIELPVVVLLLVSAIDYRNETLVNVAWLCLIALWVLVGLMACTSAVTLTTRERSRQTLDVLLATPISGRDIVHQKMAGLQRVIWVCQLPMWTCLLAFIFANRYSWYVDVVTLINQATSILIYPWLIAWIGMWHGLRSKTTLSAVLQSAFSIALRCIIPLGWVIIVNYLFVYIAFVIDTDWITRDEVNAIDLLVALGSPATIFALDWGGATSGHATRLAYGASCLLNPAIQWTLLKLLQRKCLARADILLGRTRRLV